MLENVEVVYETLPGWQRPTMGVKRFEDLPLNARKYVEWIEGFVGVPAKYIGTGKQFVYTWYHSVVLMLIYVLLGPDRESMIFR